MCAQEWKRVATNIESTNYDWAPEERRLRSEHPELQSIDEVDTNEFWINYFKQPPTTTPASLALSAGVTAYVVEAAVPRFVSTVGDTQLNVDWHLNDRILDTNSYTKTFEKTE